MKVLLDENFPLGLVRALEADGLQVDHIITLGWRGPLIPFANFCLLLKDLLSGDWSWTGYAETMFVNVAYAALAFAAAVRIFKSEEVLFRS